MSFSTDIKCAMRDCILNIFWAKKDIVSFFLDNGCTTSDVSSIGSYEELKRSEIIDLMFKNLNSKKCEGLGQFRAMLKSLINWSHFDPYYFDDLKKLNRTSAERAIIHLKQLQEIRDHKIKEDRKQREQREKEVQNPIKTLETLKDLYISLFQGSLSPQSRGYEFEKIIQELSKLSNLEVTEPFRVNGEQIDGAIKFDGEHYIIEAKWQDKEQSNEPVYQFAHKVDGKMYGRGLFISVNGFSQNVIRSLIAGKTIRTIFIDGGDLTLVLEGYLSFLSMIDKKVKAAQTQGLIYVDAITGKSKLVT
jgi:hypothetical protein